MAFHFCIFPCLMLPCSIYTSPVMKVHLKCHIGYTELQVQHMFVGIWLSLVVSLILTRWISCGEEVRKTELGPQSHLVLLRYVYVAFQAARKSGQQKLELRVTGTTKTPPQQTQREHSLETCCMHELWFDRLHSQLRVIKNAKAATFSRTDIQRQARNMFVFRL